VEKEVMITPRTATKEPMEKTKWKYPASVRRPVKVPTKNRRKTCVEPIQATSEAERLNAVT
jgi:hypothetical protein